MASIQETLYQVLAGDPTVAGVVADRIYPGQVPDDEAETPWLFWAVPESAPFDELDTDDPVARHQVEFHALADTYAEAKAIIDATVAALNTYSGGQVTRAFWLGTSEESTEDGYHHVCRCDVWARNATIIALTPTGGRVTTGDGYVTLTVGAHTLTLNAAGELLLDGEPVGSGGGGVAVGNLDGGTPSTNYGGLDPTDGGTP